jgi:hypothetical protein
LIKPEICLPIGAISGHFPLQYSPRIVKTAEFWRDPKTMVLFFAGLVSKGLPEQSIGDRIGVIRDQVI